MTYAARLVTTLAAPLDLAAADAPMPEIGPEARLIVQRGDAEVVAYDLDECAAGGEAATVRFPAPWPRRFGTVTVSPRLDLAVFAGVHALRAVDATGAVRWEVQHGCRQRCCRRLHGSLEEYADRDDHQHPGSGSAAVSADGALVWAHLRGPLASDAAASPGVLDQWLVLDAADGRVLGRMDTATSGVASYHVPHPDPGRMGLSVSEGEDGSPLLWGSREGRTLTADRLGDDNRVLLAVSPSGDRFLTATLHQETLAAHRATDGSVFAEADAETEVPRHADTRFMHQEVFWDHSAGFLDEDTVITGTVESDILAGGEGGRNWLLDAARMSLTGQVEYPFPLSNWPTALGDGTWLTWSEDWDALHLWTL
ncbi:hypothetical protein ACFV2X_02695 [Streptomyces sp. NPDC059679]|uniref:hypothetical protein n=1 Tax=Streptomyces sp. NPDC059679 TaxID=3346903 RepID=UPI003686AE24